MFVSSGECVSNFIAGSVRSLSASSEFVWVRIKSLNPVVCHRLYCPKVDILLCGYYRHCGSCFSSSSGSTDPVKVSIRILRHVIVDDVRNSVNVQTSSGKVSGNQYATLASSECTHRSITLMLGKVAV